MKVDARDHSGHIGSVYIDYSKQLGRGATATVFAARFKGKSCAAKIYHPDQPFPSGKVVSMLERRPKAIDEGNDDDDAEISPKESINFAWPFAILSNDHGNDFGLLMPLLDLKSKFPLDHFYDKILFKKLNAPEEAAISLKIEIAANLSLAVSTLHSLGHYFVDMKPQNIRVALGSHEVTLLDCDGFSIYGARGKRYPASLVSTDYIAPEVIRENLPPKILGIEQDRYSLAVIIFQLLNNGTHPFQGIPTGSVEVPPTNDEKAALGFYPHGTIKHSAIKPRPQSIHFLLDPGLRSLFDLAFVGKPEERPTAEDWSRRLTDLLQKKALMRCAAEPNSYEHIRFRDLQCPACYLNSLSIPNKPAKIRQSPSKIESQTISLGRQNYVPPPQSAKKNANIFGGDVIVLVLVLIFGFAVFVNMSTPTKPTSQNSSGTGSSSPPVSTQPSCTLNVQAETTANLCHLLWMGSAPGLCDKNMQDELIRRGKLVSKDSCGKDSSTYGPAAQGSNVKQPILTNSPKFALEELYKIQGQSITSSNLDPSYSEIWVTAVNGIAKSLGASSAQADVADGLIIFKNVQVRPFQAVRFSVGVPDCRPSNLVAVAGFCQAESKNLVCPADISAEVENQRLAGKEATHCISALIK
jgi:serine/threonine protein kinase